MAVSANRLELLQIADAVAREKSIDKGIVIAAMADAIQKAARSRYGQETNIRADINPQTGEMKLQRLMEVVEEVEEPARQISLALARARNPDAQVGDFIAEQLPPMDFGRIAAQSAKQVIVQKVREAERDRQYEEYKDRIGDLQKFQSVCTDCHVSFSSAMQANGANRSACKISFNPGRCVLAFLGLYVAAARFLALLAGFLVLPQRLTDERIR